MTVQDAGFVPRHCVGAPQVSKEQTVATGQAAVDEDEDDDDLSPFEKQMLSMQGASSSKRKPRPKAKVAADSKSTDIVAIAKEFDAVVEALVRLGQILELCDIG